MSELNLTPRQWEAAGLETLDRDMCIVAGPGAGKTTVLVERFIRLVYGGGSCLDILAFTFTEKAAAQLKERLVRAFGDHPEMRPQVERAYVSTVHGFCARLLRENALAAGVDPQFRVLDEHEAALLARQAADETLDSLYEEKPAELRGLLSGLASADVGRTLLDLYEVLRAAGVEPHQLLRGRQASESLDRLLDAAARLLRRPPACATPKQRQKRDEILDWAGRLMELRGAALSVRHFKLLREFKPGTLRDERLQSIRDELLPAASGDLIARFYQPQRDLLIEALVAFDCLYRRRKAVLGALDYADLEHAAVALLENHAEIRRTVRSRFRQILMDEFQDTNRQQARLVELLRSPGCFYAVGDINQSIYGFRHAEPEVFRRYREATGAAGGRVVELRENFRSRPDILRAAATILQDAPGIEPHRLVAAKAFPEKREPSVEVLVSLGEDAESALAQEAGWVAQRICELHGAPLVTEWEDGRAVGQRPARFEDFAVLVRNSKVIPAFTEAFEQRGIPYMVSRGQGFYAAREVADLCHLLRVLANPRDEISLAAVLRSPLAGLSDETLLRLKQGGNLAGALGSVLENGEGERLRTFAANLAAWREQRHLVSPDRLLARALDASGYQAALGPRARANVEKLLALLRARAARQSLDELVEELEALAAWESEPEAAVEEAARCLQIMTVHAAKGLEFPVVFLAAVHKGVDHGLGAACFSPDLGLGLRWRDPFSGAGCDDALLARIRKERARKEAHESERLFYVAMTRAEEHLALSFSNWGRAPAEWAHYLQAGLGLDPCAAVAGPRCETVQTREGEQFRVRVWAVDRPAPPPERLPESEALAAALSEPLPAPAGQHDSTASVTSVAQFLNCPRRYYLGRYLGWQGGRKVRPSEVEERLEAPEPDELDAAGFGRQVHAILAGTHGGPADPEALKLAERFHSSALGLRAARAVRVEREFDFVLAVEDVVLRGQIDLWFEDDGRLVLVDYKTDEIAASAAAEHAESYALQLRLYAMALERLAGRPPEEAYVYLMRPGVAVPVGLHPLFMHAAESAVREFREAQDRLDFPLREGSGCRKCPFWHGLCPAQ